MTPDNGGFAIAAYVLATVVYLGYMVTLRVRERALRARLDASVSSERADPRA